MDERTPDNLQVLVTGVDAAASRDVVRLLVAEGASVIAADADGEKLSRLERDAGLYRTHIETTEIDLADSVEVRLWEDALRAFRRLPHMIICCCGLAWARKGGAAEPPAGDVGLSVRTIADCPARVAARILKPSIFLHAEPLRRSPINRALALRHPTLQGVLDRSPGRSSVFDTEAATPYVRIASRLYSLRRHPDGDPAQLRFTTDSGAERADAA
jgi:NAD(P)-dependent dehydrogenase (short-subunit alcohol dehydrogenase family)